jgi:hypothetical protein
VINPPFQNLRTPGVGQLAKGLPEGVAAPRLRDGSDVRRPRINAVAGQQTSHGIARRQEFRSRSIRQLRR